MVERLYENLERANYLFLDQGPSIIQRNTSDTGSYVMFHVDPDMACMAYFITMDKSTENVDFVIELNGNVMGRVTLIKNNEVVENFEILAMQMVLNVPTEYERDQSFLERISYMIAI